MAGDEDAASRPGSAPGAARRSPDGRRNGRPRAVMRPVDFWP